MIFLKRLYVQVSSQSLFMAHEKSVSAETVLPSVFMFLFLWFSDVSEQPLGSGCVASSK